MKFEKSKTSKPILEDRTMDPGEFQQKALERMGFDINSIEQSDLDAIREIIALRRGPGLPDDPKLIQDWYDELQKIHKIDQSAISGLALEISLVKGVFALYPGFVFLKPADICDALAKMIARVKESQSYQENKDRQSNVIIRVLKDGLALAGVHTTREFQKIENEYRRVHGTIPDSRIIFAEFVRNNRVSNNGSSSSILTDMVDRGLQIYEAAQSANAQNEEIFLRENALIPEGLPKVPTGRAKASLDGRILYAADGPEFQQAEFNFLSQAPSNQTQISKGFIWKFESFRVTPEGARFYLLSKLDDVGNSPGGTEGVVYVKPDGTLDNTIYDVLSEQQTNYSRFTDRDS